VEKENATLVQTSSSFTEHLRFSMRLRKPWARLLLFYISFCNWR